jgi:outer membrane protein OmpA-like peptidoglycan-associated protein
MTSNARNSLRIATAVLATFSTVPFLAQTTGSASDAQVQTGTSVGGSQSSTASGTESLSATGQPLTTQSHEGFWGHLNPMARKKWVNRQLNPVKDRLNELDQLTAANAQQIKDVDARTQAGISKASQEAQLADQHATVAGNTANQAQQLSQQASTQTTNIGNTVSNLDQYQTVNSVEIRFRPGQTVLGENAKEALDQLAGQLQGQRGYLLDVQGYSPLHGSAGVATSHRMASAVTRYLVTQHQVPLYKIHEIGLGNAPLTNSDTSTRRHGSIVEVTLMHNSLSALSASNSGASTNGAAQSGTAQSSSNGTASQPSDNQ